MEQKCLQRSSYNWHGVQKVPQENSVPFLELRLQRVRKQLRVCVRAQQAGSPRAPPQKIVDCTMILLLEPMTACLSEYRTNKLEFWPPAS